MANYLFTSFDKRFNFEKDFSFTTTNNNLKFYYEILNMYSNCKFISNANKNIIKKLKDQIYKNINFFDNYK